MPTLKQLHADHAPAVLSFEIENRSFFATSITDRGDDYFEQFDDRFKALLVEQEAGICVFHVLLDDDGSVLGRFNLVDLENQSAVLGYRVAQSATGRGVATATVQELCRLAAQQYGLRTLRAAVSDGNIASQRVLAKAGFVADGPVDPADIGGKTGSWYRRELIAG